MSKTFSLVSDCSTCGQPGNGCGEKTPILMPPHISSSNKDLNVPHHSSLLHHQISLLPDNGKMVRKRAAPEVELQSGHRCHRRTPATDPPPCLGDFGVSSSSATTAAGSGGSYLTPPHDVVPNYSTTLVTPYSTHSSVTSVGGSCSDSALVFCSTDKTSSSYSADPFRITASFLHHHHHRQRTPQQPPIPPTPPPNPIASPSVCVFSGLPLFPPERNQNTEVVTAASVSFSSSSSTSTSTTVDAAGATLMIPMEDNSSPATAWIDSIIKDLIHNSAHVSIPQLIQNVREIIHPCNPNLAALIDYRLRSLTCTIADPIPPLLNNYYSPAPAPTPIPTTATDRRRKGSIVSVPSSYLERSQDYFQQQLLQGHGDAAANAVAQGQLLSGSSGLKLYLDDSFFAQAQAHSSTLHENQYSAAAAGTSNNQLRNIPITPSSSGYSFGTSALPNLQVVVQQSSSSEPENQLTPSKNADHQQQHGDSPLTPPVDAGPKNPVSASSPSPSTAAKVGSFTEKKEEIQQQKRDEEGLHLLTLLLRCAEAVAADNLEEANNMLLEISQLSTPFGTSAQRVAAYFSEAMSARTPTLSSK